VNLNHAWVVSSDFGYKPNDCPCSNIVHIKIPRYIQVL
jgi:hypothetical protein